MHVLADLNSPSDFLAHTSASSWASVFCRTAHSGGQAAPQPIAFFLHRSALHASLQTSAWNPALTLWSTSTCHRGHPSPQRGRGPLRIFLTMPPSQDPSLVFCTALPIVDSQTDPTHRGQAEFKKSNKNNTHAHTRANNNHNHHNKIKTKTKKTAAPDWLSSRLNKQRNLYRLVLGGHRQLALYTCQPES